MPEVQRVQSTSGGMIAVDLSHDDTTNILYLTREEARTVAEILNNQIERNAEQRKRIGVLEAVLTVAQAKSLAIHLDRILAEANSPSPNRKANWQKEGF